MRYLSSISLVLIVLMALACDSSDSISGTSRVATRQATHELESEKYISFVIDHIERGVPIQYKETRLVEGYSLEEMLKDLEAAEASGNIDQFNAKHMEDYLWSEDEQCHAWHQGEEWHLAQGIEWKKHDLRHPAYFHWRASFNPAEEFQRVVENHPEIDWEDMGEIGSKYWHYRNIVNSSTDYWLVSANPYEESCYWVVSADFSAIHAQTKGP